MNRVLGQFFMDFHITTCLCCIGFVLLFNLLNVSYMNAEPADPGDLDRAPLRSRNNLNKTSGVNATPGYPANYAPPKFHCYMCRSDFHEHCARRPEKDDIYVTECDYASMTSFLLSLETHPLKKTVPEYSYSARSLGTDTKWACYTQTSKDGLLVWRSCTVVGPSTVDSCDHCEMNGKPAKCCVCREEYCNHKSSRASPLSSLPNVFRYYINTLVILLCIQYHALQAYL